MRTPAPMAMLPLTEVEWDWDVYGWGGDGSGRVLGEAVGKEWKGVKGTWHNPNLMQMAEMLSAAMATRGAGEPLDVA